jgi:hypothetical protein
MDSPQRNYIYLTVSLVSGYCAMTNTHIILCSNMVGVLCAGELFFLKTKDAILHHILVLFIVHYINNHTELEYIVRDFLKTEISTIFLILRDLIGRHPVNDVCFVTTFMYYRIYKYSGMLLNPHLHKTLLIHSKTQYELCEIYMSMYLFFMLNVYWASLIVRKLCKKKRITNA